MVVLTDEPDEQALSRSASFRTSPNQTLPRIQFGLEHGVDAVAQGLAESIAPLTVCQLLDASAEQCAVLGIGSFQPARYGLRELDSIERRRW